ncbi:MAG: hypothetical protein LBJ31_09635 [Treponema sp.]|jgi:hypothetical protein|nr:hypothetical protein [Treponema sp.]
MILPRALPARAAGASAFAAAVLLTLWVIFLVRRPVILVGDSDFDKLYGLERTARERRLCALRLFRPLIYLSMNSEAGPDMISASIWSASRRPAAVFVPYRYREGARRFLIEHPQTQAAVLGARYTPETGIEEAGPAWFFTGFEADLYRAGRCAGLLALARSEAGDHVIYYQDEYQDEPFSPAPEAFIRGLRDSGWPGTPSAEQPDDRSACLVFAGAGNAVFENADIPFLILMSWADPADFPSSTVMAFDDSPWAQLEAAFKLLLRGERTAALSSKIRVSRPKNLDKALFSKIKNLKTLTFEADYADN